MRAMTKLSATKASNVLKVTSFARSKDLVNSARII